MRSFVAAQHASMNDVAVISVMGESGAPNAVAEVSRLIDRPPLMNAAFRTREVEDGSCAGRLQAFGRAVQGGEGQFARRPPVNVVAAGMRLCCSAPLSRYTAPSEDMQQAQDSTSSSLLRTWLKSSGVLKVGGRVAWTRSFTQEPGRRPSLLLNLAASAASTH